MESDQVPQFVRDGAFNWQLKGYHYTLNTDERLRVENNYNKCPWYSIAHVVELAKNGDFSETGLLSKYFDEDLTTNAAPAAMLITGDVGRNEDLERLTKIMQDGPDGFRVYACRAAANAGRIWLIPHMLEAWERSESVDAHENIGFAIADLLDSTENLDELGPIALRAGIFTKDFGHYSTKAKFEHLTRNHLNKDANRLFKHLVIEEYSNLKNAIGSDKAIVWAGKERSISKFVEYFLSLIISERFNTSLSPLVVPMRQKFEAATGIECSAFFENGKFSQMVAVGVLENFLDSAISKDYKIGYSYFFGHIIPD